MEMKAEVIQEEKLRGAFPLKSQCAMEKSTIPCATLNEIEQRRLSLLRIESLTKNYDVITNRS